MGGRARARAGRCAGSVRVLSCRPLPPLRVRPRHFPRETHAIAPRGYTLAVPLTFLVLFAAQRRAFWDMPPSDPVWQASLAAHAHERGSVRIHGK